ncbi:MAG TPA: DUF4446 family protein [Clostridiaceae bacterium]|nr:DUF4446 family protein [Clostridiaceae bacterium]
MVGIEGLFNLPSELIAVLTILNLIFIILIFFYALHCSSKIKRLRNKYNKLVYGVSEGNIEDILIECIDRMNKVEMRNRELEIKLNNMEHSIISCIQKVGIVRFNAFEDTGSDLSYSIALLNENDDGVVISSIYSRESSYTYAKPVISGNSKYPLSAEEIKAIDIAKKNGRSFFHA